MFTGIVQEVGILKEKTNSESKYQLVIEGNRVLRNVNKGDSIAINGVCLTVVDFDNNSFTADVMPETLRATNLSTLKIGSKVNLEQAVQADSFMGGHIVTGHVDTVGRVKKIKPEKNARVVEIAVNKEITEFIVDKGSVAVNGVSLTIVKVLNDIFTISLIPETWNYTNLKLIKIGDQLNIETDLIGKYVVKMLKKGWVNNNKNTQINRDFLKENGFL